MSNRLINKIIKTSGSSKSELSAYLKTPRLEFHDDFDMIIWWSNMKNNYPILWRIAFDYSLIIPTSVASERSFSIGGMMVSPERNRLHPETIREIMCLKSWNKILS